MKAARRAKAMLVDPTAEWLRIAQEPGHPAYLLSHYVALLALIPALSGLVGACVIGAVAPGPGLSRAPLFDGVFGAIFGYVATIATIAFLAVLVNILAPWFGGRRDFDSAFKLASYTSTPLWLAGIFLVLPGLRFLVLAGCYGAYVLWLGLPPLMVAPERHSYGYAAAVAVAAFVLFYATASVQQSVFGTPGL